MLSVESWVVGGGGGDPLLSMLIMQDKLISINSSYGYFDTYKNIPRHIFNVLDSL